VSAERTVRTLAWLARVAAADGLLVADLSGECGLLGAYQRAGGSGERRELRGVCGGRSAFAGEGVSVLFAVVADAGAWLGESETRGS
jgi:hypothetical protein